MNRDILPYIFKFLKYNGNYAEVSKFWNEMYIKATKIYEIEVKINNKITSEKFNEIIKLPRFKYLYSLNIEKCREINIENIIFINLRTLKISYSIENLSLDIVNTLVNLNLSKCRGLVKLPNFQKLVKLEMLSCEIIELPKGIINTLKYLIITGCEIKTIPNFSSLEILKLSDCPNITEIPNSITDTLEELCVEEIGKIIDLPSFTKLEKLTITYCENIVKIPISIKNTLKKINIISSGINTIPDFTKLEILRHCEKIKELPISTQNTLKKLYLYSCNMANLFNFTKLKKLKLVSCPNFTEIPKSICDTVKNLYIEGNLNITNLYNFNNLKKLSLLHCENITLNHTNNLINTVVILDLSYCNIKILPNFTKLRSLNISYNKEIMEFPISIRDTLEKLVIRHCPKFNNIMPGFTKLKELQINYCDIKLHPNIINTLEEFTIEDNKLMHTLPNFNKIKMLYLVEYDSITIPNYNTLEYLYIIRCSDITILTNINKIKYERTYY